MTKSGDYFTRLGLLPGSYSEQQLADRLAAIRDGSPPEDALADATLAYCVLRDPLRQRRYLTRLLGGVTPSAEGPLAAETLSPRRIEFPPGPDPGSPQPGPAAPDDLEAAFAAQVAGMLEGDTGLLRYSNRRRLLDLAARLGFGPFEANLLIERTRFRVSHRASGPGADLEGYLSESPTRPRASARGSESKSDPPGPPDQQKLTRWLIAIGLALLADAVLLIYLFPR